MQMYWTLFILGVVVSLIGFFWLVIVGFKRSVVWGLLVLLFSPLSAIIFAITNWYHARKAFLVYVASMVLIIGVSISFYSKYVPLFQEVGVRVQHGQLTKEEASQLIKEMIMSGKTTLPPVADDSNKVTQTNSEDTDKASEQGSAGTTQETGKQTVKTDKSVQSAKTESVAKAEKKDDTESAKPQHAPYPMPSPTQAPVDPLAQKAKAPESKTVLVSLNKVSQFVGHYFIITLKNGNKHRGLLRKVEGNKLILDRNLYGGSFQYRISKTQIKTLQMLKHPPKER